MDTSVPGVDQTLRFNFRDASKEDGKVCQIDVTNLKVKKPYMAQLKTLRWH
jgi:hypothetical protein